MTRAEFSTERTGRRNGRLRRVGFLFLMLVGLVALGTWRLADHARATRGNSAGPAAVPVTADTAAVRDVPDYVEELGTVQSMDSVNVQSRVSGQVVSIEFTPGADLKKGQQLFLIDPRPYQAALDQAKAQLARDQATLKQAQTDLARYQTLMRENSIAKQTAEDQVYVVQQDEGTVELDKASVENADLNVQYCHITAPISGRAGALLIDLGNLVGGSAPYLATGVSGNGQTSAGPAASGAASTPGSTGATGTGLVSITQLQPIYVSFAVPQGRLDEIRRNQAAAALEVDAYSQAGALVEKGKLTLIDNQVNTATGTVMMQGTFANKEEVLWPGEFVRVRLVVSVRRNAVTVPAQAVMAGPNGSYVYVIDAQDQVHRVDVKVAARQQGIIVIAAGLSGGERVVIDGQYRLANGVKIQVQRQTTPG